MRDRPMNRLAKRNRVCARSLAISIVLTFAMPSLRAGESLRPALHLSASVFRDDLLPYEPLLVSFRLENRSEAKSAEIPWDGGRCVKIQYRTSVGWQEFPRYEAIQAVRPPPPPEVIAPGSSLEGEKTLLCIAKSRGAPPLLTPGKWALRAAIRPGTDGEILSKPISLTVAEPDRHEEFDAFWALRQSIDPHPYRHRDNLVFFLLPREGASVQPAQRAELVAFVTRFPESRYGLYFRYTFLALRTNSYTPKEDATCDEYRQYLQKNATSFFPPYMRAVFSVAKPDAGGHTSPVKN